MTRFAEHAFPKALERALGVRFREPRPAARALLHSSFVNEQPPEAGFESYERIELLGDAVLDFLITEAGFHEHPDWNEGELSKLRGTLAGEANLVRVARRLDLGKFICLGSGETQGEPRPSILADVFEALLAAVYLDRGMDAARALVMKHFGDDIRRATRRGLDRMNHKSRLQELLQSAGLGHPHYKLDAEKGPAHDKRFTVCVAVGGRRYTGQGRSKRSAEQAAARAALAKKKQWIHRLLE